MIASQLAPWFAAAGAAALAASLALTLAARRVARRLGFVDRPAAAGHKSHREPMPYGGGSAMFVAGWLPMGAALALAHLAPDAWVQQRFGDLALALVGGMREHTAQGLIILAGGAVLHVLGVIDDMRPLGPYAKLLAMIGVAAGVSALADVRIASEIVGAGPSIALSVAWIVIITNAFNFLDNMDGLSAGVAAVCLLFLTLCGLMAGQIFVPAIAVVMLGAALGFLVLNFPPARIFMGDGGSLLLGYAIAVVSILTTYWDSGRRAEPNALAMPFVILAVPLYDFASVVIIRLLEGRNPLRGDQRHFSHRLVDRGLSRRFAVLTIYLAAATTGLGATLLPGAGLPATLTVLAMTLMVLAIVAILEMPLRKSE